nr:hypothetical protein [Candidatus Sigynarchaeota archaeon]
WWGASWTSGSPLGSNVNWLGAGNYNFTIIASDGLGGVVSDEVIVHVLNPAPTITHPLDITCNYGSSGDDLYWTITDLSIGTTSFMIYLDDLEYWGASWTSGSPLGVNVNWFPVGQHNVTIIAWDGLGASVTDQVNVTVLNVAPVLDTPPDDVYYEFNIGGFHWVSWTITDYSTLDPSYEIYLDGGLDHSDVWSTGSTIQYRVDFLSFGDHNVTLYFDDGYGSILQDEVTVFVYNVDPVLTHPDDLSFVQGTTGNSISWTVTDISGTTRNYSIFVDGVRRAFGNWGSGSPVSFNVDGLSVGTHNVTFVADDGLSGTAQDTVMVTVRAIPVPPDNTTTIVIVVLACAGGAAGVAILVIFQKKKGLSRRDASERKYHR